MAGNFDLMIKLGKCFDRKHEYKDSIQYYTRALLIQENNQAIIFRLGQAYFRMGDASKGLYHMRRSFQYGTAIISN